MRLSRKLAGIIVGLCLTSVVSAFADPVTHWNAFTVSTIGGPTARPGPPGLLDIALVQAAVHDAVQVIEGNYQPYHYADASRRGMGSTAAAVAAATRGVLVRIYSSLTPQHEAIRASVNAAYASYLSDPANSIAADDPGLEIGDDAAEALHTAHYRPVHDVTPFFGNDGVGQWRSTSALGFHHLAISTPFTLNRVDQFRPQPPPPLKSVRYALEYAEVQEFGKSSAHVPATDQTDKARFWAGNFVGQWNETLRQLADNNLDQTGDRARLFALANLAAADAAMAVWDSKVFYNFWRPITAINLGDTDGNARTELEAGWTSLVPSPPYPDYVSGANGLTGAFTGMMRQFFGTDAISFSVKNPAANVIVKERHFTACSAAAQEVVDARVLLGIHFRFADEEGRRLGERVAHWTFQKYLRPVSGQ
jgi:hypothetical protein